MKATFNAKRSNINLFQPLSKIGQGMGVGSKIDIQSTSKIWATGLSWCHSSFFVSMCPYCICFFPDAICYNIPYTLYYIYCIALLTFPQFQGNKKYKAATIHFIWECLTKKVCTVLSQPWREKVRTPVNPRLELQATLIQGGGQSYEGAKALWTSVM